MLEAVCLVDLIRTVAVRLFLAFVLLFNYRVVEPIVVRLVEVGHVESPCCIREVSEEQARLLACLCWRDNVESVHRDPLRQRVLIRHQWSGGRGVKPFDLGKTAADQHHDERTQDLAEKAEIIATVDVGSLDQQGVVVC